MCWCFCSTVRSWLELIKEKVSAASIPKVLILNPTIWGDNRHCLSSPGGNSFCIHSTPHLQAGYVSGMLAPVGIGISGALLIVGALYGIRTLHRKRRNNLKHQRKTRQQEVGVSAERLSHQQSGVFETYFLLLSNREKPGAAVRTRPCCSPTAPKTSSDLPLLFNFVGRRSRIGGLAKSKQENNPHRHDNRVSIHPRLFG